MSRLEWTDAALSDLLALDKGIARRIRHGVERFAESGIGDVKKLRDIHPSAYRLRVGEWRVRFAQQGDIIRVLRVLNRRDAYR